jgi:hypothetical protein
LQQQAKAIALKTNQKQERLEIIIIKINFQKSDFIFDFWEQNEIRKGKIKNQ